VDDEHRRGQPHVIIFDVNETLSDMSPMATRFEDVGVPGHLAPIWFAGLLRDGFALTVVGENPAFADLAVASLHVALPAHQLDRSVDDAIDHIMAGFADLAVHPDVVPGVTALHELGIRLATLSNGSASVAERLLDTAGLGDRFERLLSVEQAGSWKPAANAYGYALEECGVDSADAMLVAVHPWDTDGASRAGLRSAWINRRGGTYPAHFVGPQVEVGSLVELAALWA
jgi:2-haloacid dehalogenase